MFAYILQKDVLQFEKPLYLLPDESNQVRPECVLVPDLRVLREFSRNDIFAKSKDQFVSGFKDQITIWWGLRDGNGNIKVLKNEIPHYSPDHTEKTGLVIPKTVVDYYNLSEGDRVEFSVDQVKQAIVIDKVNGFSDIQIIRLWKNVQFLQSDYPKKPLPIEKFGNLDLRAITLLAPIGLGQSYWIIAPGNSGKTWIMVEVLKACVQLLPEIPNLHVIIGYVGDRPEDAPQYGNVVTDIKNPRVEFYQSPWSDQPINQVEMTKFIINRARRLTSMGKHVVLLFDSISRVVSADTNSKEGGSGNGGMIKGGIYRSSLSNVIQGFFGIHGYFDEDKSLTIIGTVLSSTEDSSESVVDTETSATSTTAILRLLNIPTLEYPKISINSNATYTRFPLDRDFRSEAQVQEMNTVYKKIWELGSRAEAAHKELLKYCKDNPLPKY